MKYYPAIKKDEKNQLQQVVKGCGEGRKGEAIFPQGVLVLHTKSNE